MVNWLIEMEEIKVQCIIKILCQKQISLITLWNIKFVCNLVQSSEILKRIIGMRF